MTVGSGAVVGYRYCHACVDHRGTWAVTYVHKHESFCAYVQLVPNVATCEWVAVYGTLVIEVRSPVSAEMFAQLKHYALRHISEGCQH